MPSIKGSNLANRYAPREHNRAMPMAAAAWIAGVWLAPRVTAGLWPLWFAAVAGLLALVLWLCRRSALYALLPLLLMGALFWTQHALDPLVPQTGMYERITATVYGEPVQRSNGRIALTLCNVRLNGTAQAGKAYCTLYEDSGIPADTLFDGAALAFEGAVYQPGGKDNEYDFDFRLWLLQNGIGYGITGVKGLSVTNLRATAPWTDVASRIRGFCESQFSQVMGEQSKWAMAMLLGSRDGLADAEQTAFQRAGVAHLMSVSGLHVALIAGALSWLLNLLALRKAIRLPLLMAFIVCYCALTGFSPASVRATVMIVLWLLAQAAGRKPDMLTTLSVAALIVLLFNPLDLFSAGFVLSFTAMLGIMVLVPRILAWFKRSPNSAKPRPGKLCAMLTRLFGKPGELFAVSLAAQTGVLLPTAAYFHQLPLYGIVFNMVAVPLAGLLVPLYALTLVLSLLPFVGGVLAAVPGFAAKWGSALLMNIVNLSNLLPFAQVRVPMPGIWAYAGVAGCLLAVSRNVRVPVKRRALAVTVSVLIAVVGTVATQPPTLRYHQFAVGQGDAALLVDGAATVAIDVGTYGSEVAQRLLAEGRNLDALILTHLHNDHALGVATLLEDGIAIRNAYLPFSAAGTAPTEEGGSTLALLQAQGVPIHYLSAGDTLTFEHASVEVLWPQAGHARAGLQINDLSMATLVRLGDIRILSMADVTQLYERYVAVACDVLKVGHHGSAKGTQDAFLALVAPHAALVTCKADAALPSPATLDRLTAHGAQVFRTDETGEVILIPTVGGYRMLTYKARATDEPH